MRKDKRSIAGVILPCAQIHQKWWSLASYHHKIWRDQMKPWLRFWSRHFLGSSLTSLAPTQPFPCKSITSYILSFLFESVSSKWFHCRLVNLDHSFKLWLVSLPTRTPSDINNEPSNFRLVSQISLTLLYCGFHRSRTDTFIFIF